MGHENFMADLDRAEGAAARPLSPHLQIYKPTITMIMSILHRLTGVALYLGTIILVWWLVSAASGPGAFDTAQAILGSFLGRLVLFGYTWALFHHMMGGLRHFIWDAGAMMDKHTASKMAWLSAIASAVLTLLTWVVGYSVMGG